MNRCSVDDRRRQVKVTLMTYMERLFVYVMGNQKGHLSFTGNDLPDMSKKNSFHL